MPRCGCPRGQDALACACAIAAGEGIDVTGDGTPGISPYIISLANPGPGVEVEDTDTVDMTMTGQDPAVIRSDVKLSTDGGNALVQGSDGGLYVPDGTAATPPQVIALYQTVTRQIPDQQPTPLEWDVADPDYHVVGTQITIQRSGPYVLSLTADFDGRFSAGRLSCWFAVAGDPYNRITATWRAQYDPAAYRPGVSGSEPVYLEQGQVIEAVVYQYSEAPRFTRVDDRATRAKIAFLGGQ